MPFIAASEVTGVSDIANVACSPSRKQKLLRGFAKMLERMHPPIASIGPGCAVSFAGGGWFDS